MNLSNTAIYGTQFGSYLWSVLICVNKQPGYGSFSTLMPYPPTEKRSVEFYETPEGDFSGTIIHVNEAVKFAPCHLIQASQSFGIMREIKVQPSVIEFQVWIDVKCSSNLTHFGVPEL